MSVYFTKWLSLLLYPLTWVLLLLIMSMVFLFLRRHFAAGQSLALGFLILWIASMPITGQWLTQQLETQYPAKLAHEYGSVDAIVVLGGGVKGAAEPHRPMPDLLDAADRVWFAAQLYHNQKAPMIIASGGALGWTGAVQTEASAMRSVLHHFGVPPARVMEEDKSLTTQENAYYTEALLQDMKAQRILLVTSATHMPRAYRTFRRQMPSMIIIAAPTDHRVSTLNTTSFFNWLPQVSGLEMTNAAWHEWVGKLVYEARDLF